MPGFTERGGAVGVGSGAPLKKGHLWAHHGNGTCPLGRAFPPYRELHTSSKHSVFPHLHRGKLMLGTYECSCSSSTGASAAFCSLRQCTESCRWAAAKRRLSDNVDGLRQVGLCSVHPVHAIRVLLHELPEKPSFLFSLPSENLTFTFDFGIHSLPHSAPEICSCSIFNFSCTFCKWGFFCLKL